MILSPRSGAVEPQDCAAAISNTNSYADASGLCIHYSTVEALRSKTAVGSVVSTK